MALPAAFTDDGWALWTPEASTTGGGMTHGTSAVRTGMWRETEGTMVEAVDNVIRFGANMHRGDGVIRLALPAPVHVLDPQGFSIVGGGQIGWTTRAGFPQHRVVALHACGTTGFVSTSHAVIVPDGGGFASHAVPAGGVGGKLGNIHFWLRYPKEQA